MRAIAEGARERQRIEPPTPAAAAPLRSLLRRWLPLEPKRPVVLGEFGGLGLKVDGHTWTKDTWGYQGTRDRADLTYKYERLLKEAWRLHREASKYEWISEPTCMDCWHVLANRQ